MLNLKYLVIPLFVGVFFIISCGNKEQGHNTPQNDQNQTKNEPGGEVQKNVDPEKNPGTNELGFKGGLPADYPADVPQPKNSKVMNHLSTSEGMVVTFESDEMPMAILEQFKTELEKNGFKKDAEESVTEKGGMVMWKKDNRECQLMLSRDDSNSKTSVVVTYK
jgi:hypothetical protein